jgi:hypothetical protein
MFKYNKSKIEAALEEEKAGRRRDRGANKKEHMDHPYMISSSLPLGRVLYNP